MAMAESKETIPSASTTDDFGPIATRRTRRRAAVRQCETKPQTKRKRGGRTKAKKTKIIRFEGFCWWCTNPKPTLKCSSTCGRFFHPHCLESYLRGDLQPGMLDETTGEVGRSVVNWNDSDDDTHNQIQRPPTIEERNERNLRRFGQEADDEKDREESTTSSKPSTDHSDGDISVPTSQSFVQLMDVDEGAEGDVDQDATPETVKSAATESVASLSTSTLSVTENKDESDGKEIEQRHAPPFPDDCADPKAFLQQLTAEWANDHIQTLFECLQCHVHEHSCFICNERGDEAVTACTEDDCGHFYHMSCLDDDKWRGLYYTSTNGLVCPRHRCASEFCTYSEPLPTSNADGKTGGKTVRRKRRKGAKKRKGQSKDLKKLRQCWYCPRAYHRNCVPPKVELPAMNLTMTPDDNVKQPDYIFDLIICRDHPASQDGLFGRNDAANNVLALNFSAFGVLEDVVVGLPQQKAFNPYEYLRPQFEKRQSKINASCPIVANPFDSDYKVITSNKYIQPAKKPKWSQKMMDTGDYMQCKCTESCDPETCFNALWHVECFEDICSAPDSCQNRPFSQSDPAKWPIVIKQTQSKGKGTFASRPLQKDELIVEYVGEVLTMEEGNRRLDEMNKNGAPNFYFMKLGAKLMIDARHSGNVGRFLNHSCQPNCRCDLWDVKGVPRLGIFADRAISKGDELTYDYKYEVKNPDSQGRGLQECRCGAPNCRIFLGFSNRLAAEFRIKYPEDVPSAHEDNGQGGDDDEQPQEEDDANSATEPMDHMDVDDDEDKCEKDAVDSAPNSDVEMEDLSDKENKDTNETSSSRSTIEVD